MDWEVAPLLTLRTSVEFRLICTRDLQEIGHYVEHGYYEIVPNNIGDISWDYKVDIKDVAIAAIAFGSFPEHPRWNQDADINGDEKIDIKDIATIALNFGWEMDP